MIFTRFCNDFLILGDAIERALELFVMIFARFCDDFLVLGDPIERAQGAIFHDFHKVL